MSKKKAKIKHKRSKIKNPPRRGILLLVVLSLLVLFLLIGTSFIKTSDQYRQSSKTISRPYEAAANPLQQSDLLDVALGQLVRGTTNPYSSIRFHSLLGDMYGYDGVLIGPNSPQNVRFLDFATDTVGGFTFIPNDSNSFKDWGTLISDMENNTGNQFFWAAVTAPAGSSALSAREDFYTGRTFTMLDGPAAGRSARVMRYFVDLANNRALFYLKLIDSDRNFSAVELDIQPTDHAVINGQAFNGTGAGYNPFAGPNEAKLIASEQILLQDGSDPNLPITLMPNGTYFASGNLHQLSVGDYGDLWPGLGGVDESYDAVDFQNMALAWMPVDPVETLVPDLESGILLDPLDSSLQYDRDNLPPGLGYFSPTSGRVLETPVPSFHRPALLNYWQAVANVKNEPNLLRKVMMRPSWYDHPSFTGTNGEFEAALATLSSDPNSRDPMIRMVYGPWDVDNDGDGRRDSVWVDIGLPVMEGPQGVMVKPLAAILCIDMDGRLNLNAHGSRQSAGMHFNGVGQSDPNGAMIAGGYSSKLLPSGQGYGPGEIDLWPVLSGVINNEILNDSNDNDWLYSRILIGVPANEPDFYDEYGNQFQYPIAGRYGTRWNTNTLETPGEIGSYDLLSQLKLQGTPQRADTNSDYSLKLGNYATPPDLFGRYGLGVNDLGQAVYEVINDNNMNLDGDSPYELNLSRLGPHSAGNGAQDGPFSVAEFERILRAYDRDAGKLPDRLWQLANSFDSDGDRRIDQSEIGELQEWRGLLTTDSFDVPVPNVTLPQWMLRGISDPNASDDFSVVMAQNGVLRQPVNLTFADLLEYRVRIGLGESLNIVPNAVDPNAVRIVTRQLMAPELASGQRIDLNRPFGNGRDDNFNGIVDEPGEWDDLDNDRVWDPGEVEAPFWTLDRSRIQMSFANGSDGTAEDSFENSFDAAFRNNIDRNGDGVIEPFEAGYLETIGMDTPIDRFQNADPLTYRELVKVHNFRRQLYARHLYVLAQTLVDPLGDMSGLNATKQKELRVDRARRLAQWAINVVDFRDPDNISTGFEFAVDPFRGWVDPGGNYVDGDLNSAQDPNDSGVVGVVWGAERPDLVITETLAWHDRRVTDQSGSDQEGENSDEEPEDAWIAQNPDAPDAGVGTAKAGEDRSFDQKYRPQGAALIELYNPWAQETAANADTHAVEDINVDADGQGPSGSIASGTDLGVNLAAFTRDPNNPNDPAGWSPVWRMLVYRDGGLGKDPTADDPLYRPGNLIWREPLDATPANANQMLVNQAISIEDKADRSIYFTNFDPADAADGTIADPNAANYSFWSSDQSNPNTTAIITDPNTGKSYWDENDGVAFFRSATTPLFVRPGRYMVVAGADSTGPASQLISGDPNNGEYLIEFGRSGSTGVSDDERGIYLNTNWALNTSCVQVRGSNGQATIVQDQDGFTMECGVLGGASMASVAIIDSALPNPYYDRSRFRRFTFSEPAGGYPDQVPLHRNQSKAQADSTWSQIAQRYQPVMDRPMDERRLFDSASLNYDPDQRVSIAPATEYEYESPTTMNDGDIRLMLPLSTGQGSTATGLRTLPAYCWVYLQRLRNPLLPWNPEPVDPNGVPERRHRADREVNPYMTVDVSGVNLTVFNGEASFQAKDELMRPPPEEGMDEEQVKNEGLPGHTRYQNVFPRKTFASVQRGRLNNPIRPIDADVNWNVQHRVLSGNLNQGNMDDPVAALNSADHFVANLWSPEPIDSETLWENRSGPQADGRESSATAGNDVGIEVIPDCTIGFLNEGYRDPNAANDFERRIAPEKPFSWVTWNNRSFVSSGELLQVPAFSSNDLRRVMAFASQDPNSQEVYRGDTIGLEPDLTLDGPFPHLMNFFRNRANAPDPNASGTTVGNPGIAGMYRILEYVGVPSRYVGTETWLSPVFYGGSNLNTTSDSRYLLQPPFNSVAAMREPGKVNLNTITDARVWEGGVLQWPLRNQISPWDPNSNPYVSARLLDPSLDYDATTNPILQHGHLGPSFSDLAGSRHGSGVSLNLPLTLDPSSPTFFANPYRSATAGDLVPLLNMSRLGGLDGTLLRSRVGNSSGPSGAPVMYLQRDSLGNPTDPSDDVQHFEAIDTERNSHFRYQAMSRLPNLTTNHSNVYAVWITIGFFEVSEALSLADFATINELDATDPTTFQLYSLVYPEGYQFGKEYGIDTGDTIRLREFSIIDRSVPVAFEPGKNHNAERAIRLKRRLE